MRSFHFFLFLIIFLLVTANILQATEDTLQEIPDYTYPIRLFYQQDYYRSVSEILRLKFLFPLESTRHKLDLYLVKNYYQMGLYGQSEQTANLLLDSHSEFREPTRRKIGMFLTFSQLRQNKYQLAGQTWYKYVSQDITNQPPTYENLPDRVDPAQARLYSSIIPGSGLILSQQYGSALVSFIINVAFITGSYHYLHNKQYGIAGLLIFFEIGWYMGGKKAAYEAAEAYNYHQLKELQTNWIDSQKKTIN